MTTDGQPRPSAARSLLPYAGWTLIIFALAFGTSYVLRSCARAPAEAVAVATHALAGAFKDAFKSDTGVIVHSAITTVSHEPKLVVWTASFTTTADARKTSPLGGLLGTTTSHLVALDNKAQYYVPLANLTESDFHYDPHDRVIRVRVPPPILDESMIVVQPDPTKIIVETSAGWASLKAFEGKAVEDEARKQLLPNVKREAAQEPYRIAARESARRILAEHLYAPLKDRLKDGVRLEIDFQEPATTATSAPTSPSANGRP
ncbi:MAG TPA: DUF4230 domain-containing protein [Phycisphaerales bacterium]|nr:DUF4230 domain-containing protein [Phycisphaerales bacterium]